MEYMTVSQYAKKTGRDSGNIRRMLIEGRLCGKKLGNQWMIPVDAVYPVDARIKSGKYRNWRKKPILMLNHPELVRTLVKMSAQISNTYGKILDRVVIYGSYARGEETEESDIDIALILRNRETEEQHNAMTDIVVDNELNLNKTLSVVTIEKENYSAWKRILPFYKNLDEEGVVIWKAQ